MVMPTAEMDDLRRNILGQKNKFFLTHVKSRCLGDTQDMSGKQPNTQALGERSRKRHQPKSRWLWTRFESKGMSGIIQGHGEDSGGGVSAKQRQMPAKEPDEGQPVK